MRKAAIQALMIAGFAALSAAPLPEIELARTELKGPVTLHLGFNHSVTGRIARVTETSMIIDTTVAGGEVSQTFGFDRIEAIGFPGDSYASLALEWVDSGRKADARQLMDLIFEQRAQLLMLQQPEDAHYFIHLAQLHLENGNPARALAVIDLIRPYIESEEAGRALDDAVLESNYTLEFFDKAKPLAEQWVGERDAYGGSALGFAVLSSIQLRNEQHETALETALIPIVFSTALNTEHLERCYAVAIASAFEIREDRFAATLFKEMKERGLDWPTEKLLFPYHQQLTDDPK